MPPIDTTVSPPRVTTGAAAESTSGVALSATSTAEHHALGSGRRRRPDDRPALPVQHRPQQRRVVAGDRIGVEVAVGERERAHGETGVAGDGERRPGDERRAGDGVGHGRHVADQLGAGGGSRGGARRRSGGRRSGRPRRTAPAAPGGSPVPCSGRSTSITSRSKPRSGAMLSTPRRATLRPAVGSSPGPADCTTSRWARSVTASATAATSLRLQPVEHVGRSRASAVRTDDHAAEVDPV